MYHIRILRFYDILKFWEFYYYFGVIKEICSTKLYQFHEIFFFFKLKSILVKKYIGVVINKKNHTPYYGFMTFWSFDNYAAILASLRISCNENIIMLQDTVIFYSLNSAPSGLITYFVTDFSLFLSNLFYLP